MPVMRTFIAAAIVGLGSLPSVIAWGAAGHEIVATLAQSHLDPRALSAVCSILGSEGNGVDGGEVHTRADGDAPCYLSAVATWADKIRWRAHWSSPLHFAEGVSDHPPDNCQFPGADGWANGERANVLDAIQNVSSILTDFASGGSLVDGQDAAEEALKFLIHFVGDMHQPLHLCGRARGGNEIKVHWDNRVMKFHAVWDNALIAKGIRLTPDKYSKPLRAPALESSLRGAIYDPYVRRIYWEGLGNDQQSGRWGPEVDSWLSCPPAPSFEFEPMQLGQSPPQEVLMGAATAPRRKPRMGSGPPATSDSDTLCPYAWAAPVQALNCGVVWPAELEDPQFATHDADDEDDEDAALAGRAPRKEYLELDTPEYSGQIEKDWLIEKLLMQGGVRLAAILNAIFAPPQ